MSNMGKRAQLIRNNENGSASGGGGARNGRRSGGASPNGHANNNHHNNNNHNNNNNHLHNHSTAGGGTTPDNSDEDNSNHKRNGKSKPKQNEYDEKIRVGRDYQAVCPAFIPEADRNPDSLHERALLVWSPTNALDDKQLEDYVAIAKDRYNYNGEQALGMLFWHKHDLERAMMDLSNFTPFPDEWSPQDKVLFEQAFQFHGKTFYRIRQMLPDKTMASLVKYYYSWKKTRHRCSANDRARNAVLSATVRDNLEGNGQRASSQDDSDGTGVAAAAVVVETDDKVQVKKQIVENVEMELVSVEQADADAAMPDAPVLKISQRWTNTESEMLIHALRDYGKNFAKIAEILGTKTEGHVRTYYVNNRRRLNLDQVLKEHTAKAAAVNSNSSPAVNVKADTATATDASSDTVTTTEDIGATAVDVEAVATTVMVTATADVCDLPASDAIGIDLDSSNERTADEDNRNNLNTLNSSPLCVGNTDSGDSDISIPKLTKPIIDLQVEKPTGAVALEDAELVGKHVEQGEEEIDDEPMPSIVADKSPDIEDAAQVDDPESTLPESVLNKAPNDDKSIMSVPAKLEASTSDVGNKIEVDPNEPDIKKDEDDDDDL